MRLLPLQLAIALTILSLGARAGELEYEQEICQIMAEAQVAVNKGELGIPAKFYSNHAGTDPDQDIYCNNTSTGWPTTITQFIHELSQNKKLVDLVKHSESYGEVEVEDVIESEHPGEGKSASAHKLDPVKKTSVAKPALQSKIGNGHCFQGLKETLAESFKSKPVIEIYICGTCPTTTEDPDAITKIERTNLSMFSNQVKKKDANMYLSYFSIDATDTCSYYTFINPTERPLKKKESYRKKASSEVDSGK